MAPNNVTPAQNGTRKTPAVGAENERARSQAVKEMFGSIAARYDFLNHFLSGNVDRVWRRSCVREIARRLDVERPKILDVGCGTADLSISFSRLGNVVGCDFCHPMLLIGKQKVTSAQTQHRIDLLEGDALRLPFPDSSYDAVVSAFVLRNLEDVVRGLEEMRRVLRPGGVLGILDFSMPKHPVFGRLFRFYFTRVLPKLGRALSGVDGPYNYLPESVRSFPRPEQISCLIRDAGFDQLVRLYFTGGIAVLYLANKKS